MESTVQPEGWPIPAAVRFKVKNCSCLIAGITFSNPTESMNVRLLCSFMLSR